MASRPKLLVIDLLRFCAAVAVMAYHFGSVAPLLAEAPVQLFGPGVALPQAAARWTWCGWVGVQIFFVISGYVIALSAEGVSAGAFLRRRVLRLVPAAWICSSITAAVLIAWSAYPPAVVLQRWGSAILFVPSRTPIDGSYWTLGLETVFYLLCALALHARAVSVERLGIGLGTLSVGFWALQSVLPMSEPMLNSIAIRHTLLPHGCFFGLGVVLYAMRRRPVNWALRGLATAFFSTGLCEILDQATAQTWATSALLYPWLPLGLFGLAVTAVANADALQSTLGRALPPRTLGLIGLATYPLYLLHQTVGSALIVVLVRSGVLAAVAICGTAVAMIGFAIAVTLWFEPVLRGWMARRLMPARVPPPDIQQSASLPAG
jgi:peptidoglycan/LPS O-acetylase OafA/YrhL